MYIAINISHPDSKGVSWQIFFVQFATYSYVPLSGTKRGEEIFEYPTGTHTMNFYVGLLQCMQGRSMKSLMHKSARKVDFFCKKMTTSYKYVFQDFPILTCMYCIPMFYGLCRSRPSRQNQSIIESTEIIIFNASRYVVLQFYNSSIFQMKTTF